MDTTDGLTRELSDAEIALMAQHASESATLELRHRNERYVLRQRQANEAAALRLLPHTAPALPTPPPAARHQ